MTYISQIDGANLAATKLVTARDFSVAGDAVATAVSFNGTGNVELSVTLQNSDTVRSHLGLGSAAVKAAATTGAGNVALIGSDGLLDASIVPKTVITDVFVSSVQWAATYEAAYALGKTWAENKLAESTTGVGDVLVVNIAWGGTSAEPTSTATGSYIVYEESGTKKLAELKTPDETRIATLESKVSALETAVGSDSTSGTIKGRIKAIETDLDATTSGSTGEKLANVIAAVGDASTSGTIEYKLANHIGLGGEDATGAATHPVATASATGFMPKLSSTATQYLGGDGAWHEISVAETHTIIPTTGATAGAITKVGTHYGIAKDATNVYATGVVSFGTGHTIGQSVWVKTDDNTVSYGDIPSAAGTYQLIGYTVAADKIEIAASQQTFTVVA